MRGCYWPFGSAPLRMGEVLRKVGYRQRASVACTGEADNHMAEDRAYQLKRHPVKRGCYRCHRHGGSGVHSALQNKYIKEIKCFVEIKEN